MAQFFFSYLLFAPLLGAMLLLGGGSQLGPRGAAATTLLLGLGQLLCCGGLLPLPLQGSGVLRLDYGTWFTVGELRASWAFLLDALSLPMASLVVGVSTVTQLYAYWYLAADPALVRFQGYLQLFTFGMLLLVFADNFGVFFLGWEGVGLCSFLLIGFWHHRPEARYAALKAVTVNRVGDVALLAAVGLLTSISGSLEFGVNFAVLPLYENHTLTLGGYEVGLLILVNSLLLVAVAAKSAQLGLHTWLADAMEGPTPVSALIHAATMVTAGIYLVLRCGSLFSLTPAVGTAMALLGAYTAFFGAAAACCQWDLKKVVAYSTCSQLGYMLCACGVGGYGPAFQHLLCHGFFKALLFLAAGVLIHQLGGEQDLRRMGALRAFLPLTVSYFGVGFAALLGLPGTSGFYSKERILDLLGTFGEGSGRLCYGLLWLALVGTAFYSAKVLCYAFGGTIFRGSRSAFRNLSQHPRGELPRWLLPVLGLLVLLSLTAEQLYQPYTLALGGAALEEALGLSGDPRAVLVEEGTRSNRWLPFGALTLGVSLFGLAEFWAVPHLRRAFHRPRFLLEALRFGQQGWYFDSSLQTLCFGTLRPLLDAGFRLEKGLLEWLGPYGVGLLLNRAQRWLEVANLGRSVFGSLGLASLAYGLLLLAVFGADAEASFPGEMALPSVTPPAPPVALPTAELPEALGTEATDPVQLLLRLVLGGLALWLLRRSWTRLEAAGPFGESQVEETLLAVLLLNMLTPWLSSFFWGAPYLLLALLLALGLKLLPPLVDHFVDNSEPDFNQDRAHAQALTLLLLFLPLLALVMALVAHPGTGLRLFLGYLLLRLLDQALAQFWVRKPFGRKLLGRFTLVLLLLSYLGPWLGSLFPGATHLLLALRLFLGVFVLQFLKFRFRAETLSFSPKGFRALCRLTLMLLLTLALLGPPLMALATALGAGATTLALYRQWWGVGLLVLVLLSRPLALLLQAQKYPEEPNPSGKGFAWWLFLVLQLHGLLESLRPASAPSLAVLLKVDLPQALAQLDAAVTHDQLVACLRLLLGGWLLRSLWLRFRWSLSSFGPEHAKRLALALLLVLGHLGPVLLLVRGLALPWLVLLGCLLGSLKGEERSPLLNPFGEKQLTLLLLALLLLALQEPALAQLSPGIPSLLLALRLALGGYLLKALVLRHRVEPLTLQSFGGEEGFCGLLVALLLLLSTGVPLLTLMAHSPVFLFWLPTGLRLLLMVCVLVALARRHWGAPFTRRTFRKPELFYGLNLALMLFLFTVEPVLVLLDWGLSSGYLLANLQPVLGGSLLVTLVFRYWVAAPIQKTPRAEQLFQGLLLVLVLWMGPYVDWAPSGEGPFLDPVRAAFLPP